MKKYIKYFKYLIKHKWYVMLECFKFGLYWRGIIHDISKILPDELIPYTNYFYGKNMIHTQIGGDDPDFDLAWLKHQKRNKHHWQYWILREDQGALKCLDMPEKYATEMFCDWVGAGKALHGKNEIKEWYEENKNNIKLSSKTREYIEGLIRTRKN